MEIPKLKPISKLPLHVIEEILCRLPKKSLMRFRCLSKKYCSLMDNPDFIESYLTANSNHSLIVSGNMPICFVDLDSLDNLNLRQVDDPFDKSKKIASLIGSCKGLIALYNSRNDIVMWNPSTKEHQVLPHFQTTFCHSNYIHDGFGYDVVSGDYKLVRILLFFVDKKIKITVYNLKANSWRVVRESLPHLLRFRHRIGALVGSALHWLTKQYTQAEEYIFSFDVKNEKVFQLPLPELNEKFYMHLDVLEGCLRATSTRHGEGVFDVWLMKEYRVKESWTKLFSLSAGEDAIGNSPNFRRFSVYSKCGDKVLFGNDQGILYWYDLSKKRVKIVQSHGWLRGISKLLTSVNSLDLFKLIQMEQLAERNGGLAN